MHSRILSVFSGAIVIAQLAHASPLPNANLEQRDVCKGVQAIVSVLKVHQATPFCSSYLDIKTVTVPATTIIQAVATTMVTNNVETTFTQTIPITITENAYATVTKTAQTDVLSFKETTTVATVPTTVGTSTFTDWRTTSVTVTPAPYIIYSTVYTTPGAAKRTVGLEERGPKPTIPAYMQGFASSVISKACSCLSIPTPSITSTLSLTETSTLTQQATQTITKKATQTLTNFETSTITDTVYDTLTLRTTDVVRVTSFAPTYASTTVTSTSTVTSTLPQATQTQVVKIPYVPQCVNILKDKKLYYYQNFQTGRAHRGLGMTYSPIQGEEGVSQCCQKCFGIADCTLFNYYEFSGQSRCELVGNTDTINNAISETCPRGISPNSAVTGPGTDKFGGEDFYYSSGFGPCFKV